MTGEELDRLKRRFGIDVSAWPAPYRQEAQELLAKARTVSVSIEDADLDRLILEAARMETDEEVLRRKVQERIGPKRRPFFRLVPMMSSWQLPAATASFAAILVATGIAGYSVAGQDYGRIDSALLALAIGDPVASGIETGLPRGPNGSLGEEGLQ